LLQLFSVGWNILEGIIAIGAGISAASIALVGFGIDSFIETASAVTVAWRTRAELQGRTAAALANTEERASRVAGGLLLALALYIVLDAGRRLLGFGAHAEESHLGIGITALSLLVMPGVGYAKLRTARELRSRALRADAYETITCAWLSLTTLAGLLLNAILGWWWADPLAAIALVPLIVREGLEAFRHDECAHDDAP
jgi:divalent metal cation (Fe/Co/Zn/Cd) transporter